MSFLFLKAYWSLLSFDPQTRAPELCGNFHGKVRDCPLDAKQAQDDAVERICSAVNMACIWYWKEVLCLQRSAATACLLKRHGVAAQMVIGAQQMPFKAHAWVEVGGRVVNDKPYMPEMYVVLDRC